MILSFIIPSYNAARYISKAIDSIYNLPIANDDFEVIVVDDGSNDDTEDILLRYIGLYDNFRYIKQENLGAGVARNNGAKVAKGEYIQFVDSDDFLVSNKISEIISVLKNDNLDILALDTRLYEEYINDKVVIRNNVANRKMNGEEYLLTQPFIQSSPCLYIFRTNFICNNPYDKKLRWGGEDIEHTTRSIFVAERIKYLPIFIYIIVPRLGSLSRTINIKFELALLDSIKMGFEFFNKQDRYNQNPILRYAIGDRMLYHLIIQMHQLPLIEFSKILKFCIYSKKYAKMILGQNVNYTKEVRKQVKYLKLLNSSIVLLISYIILLKILYQINHRYL